MLTRRARSYEEKHAMRRAMHACGEPRFLVTFPSFRLLTLLLSLPRARRRSSRGAEPGGGEGEDGGEDVSELECEVRLAAPAPRTFARCVARRSSLSCLLDPHPCLAPRVLAG